MNELLPGEFTRQVLLLRQGRNYLENRLRLQHDLHDAQADLVRLHKDEVDRLRPLVEEREQLLAAIPSARGNVSLALAYLRGLATQPVLPHGSPIETDSTPHPVPLPVRGGEGEGKGGRVSHCVAVRSRLDDGFTLFCENCGEFALALKCNTKNPTVQEEREIADKLEEAWQAHIRSKSPSDNLSGKGGDDSCRTQNSVQACEGAGVTKAPALSSCGCTCELCQVGLHCCPDNRYCGVHSTLPGANAVPSVAGVDSTEVNCMCGCDLCRRGVHCGLVLCGYGPAQVGRRPVLGEDVVLPENPNAGVKQAYPKGRWGASVPANVEGKSK